MLDDFNIRTEDMPSEMQVLLHDYPRDTWPSHPGFREKTKHWLDAHRMFRKLAASVRGDVEDFLDANMDAEGFANAVSANGNALVRNLHGHHGWEDRVYFPELSKAEPRFDAGMAILENDHAELDFVLDQFTRTANRTIQLCQLDAERLKDEAAVLYGVAGTIEAFLDRHLKDEEELAVPIILHHRLRG